MGLPLNLGEIRNGKFMRHAGRLVVRLITSHLDQDDHVARVTCGRTNYVFRLAMRLAFHPAWSFAKQLETILLVEKGVKGLSPPAPLMIPQPLDYDRVDGGTKKHVPSIPLTRFVGEFAAYVWMGEVTETMTIDEDVTAKDLESFKAV
jgi:hypothetical protein